MDIFLYAVKRNSRERLAFKPPQKMNVYMYFNTTNMRFSPKRRNSFDLNATMLLLETWFFPFDRNKMQTKVTPIKWIDDEPDNMKFSTFASKAGAVKPTHTEPSL